MSARTERTIAAALGFTVPVVWAGVGAGTALACIAAAAVSYAAVAGLQRSAPGRPRLGGARQLLDELAGRLPARREQARARTRPRPPQPVLDYGHDEPSEAAVTRYGW